MRRLILYGVIIFQIVLIASLVRGIQLSRRSVSRIEDLQTTKEKLEAEQKKLKVEESYVGSTYYIEKVARDELYLAKQGETIVIVPDEIIHELGDGDGSADSLEEKENWQKWWEVLSGRM